MKYFKMKFLKQINKKDKRNTSKSLVLVFFRIFLGLALFIKGINFARNQELLEKMILNIAILEKLSFLKIVIPFIHILGGFCIIIGIYSKLAILIQIPILLAAITFLLISGVIFYYREILFAVTILILLFIYLKIGDGFYSWRNLINNEKNIS
jgi:putative oxidoreductase